MIKFRNVTVRSFSLDYQDVVWEIAPTTEDMQDYSLYVERSEAEAGPWDTIAGPLIDRYFLRDSSVPLISNTRTLFYRIKAQHNLSKDIIYSEIVDRRGTPDIYAREMIRLENIMFSEFVGVRAWLFPRRTFGQKCPHCWDDILQKKRTDNCRTCWGTTYSGGYHYPIQMWCQLDEMEKADQVTKEDFRQIFHFSLRTGPSPDIKPGDLVVDHFNRRLRAYAVGGSKRFGVTVRQEVKCVIIQKGSIEDSIPLKVPKDVKLVPVRNFSNPQSSEGASFSDIFNLYGYKQ